VALIEVKIPEGEGLNVLGMWFTGGASVSVPADRAKALIAEGAVLVHDVLGELTGKSERPDAVGAFTTEDLQGGVDPDADEDGPETEPETDEALTLDQRIDTLNTHYEANEIGTELGLTFEEKKPNLEAKKQALREAAAPEADSTTE